MNSSNGVSIVIPAYNEQEGIGKTLDSMINTLKKAQNICAFEVIVVDDGSGDDTSIIASKFDNVKIIRHPHNVGYGRSLKAGIKSASFDTVVITDADATYPVQDIPRLYDTYNEGYDMVVGARTGEVYRHSLFKSTLRRILKFLVEWSCEKKIDDINSGFRIFSKKTVSQYFFHLCDTFSFTTSLTLVYMFTGKFVKYIPIDYYIRDGNTHVRLFRDSIRTISYILKQILYFNPLKIFFLFALIWILGGLLAFMSSAFLGLSFGYHIAILSILAFFIMIGLGLLAEQLRLLIFGRNSIIDEMNDE